MARRHVALLFRRELTDMRRERRVLRALFLQPFAFILLLAAPVTLLQREERQSRATTFAVAVEGDVAAIPSLAPALDRDPFRIDHTDDAARRLATEAVAAAVILPVDIRTRAAAGEPIVVTVLTDSSRKVAERAVPILARRLAEVRHAESERVLVASGAPPTLDAPVEMKLRDVATTSAEGIRFGIGQGIPALLVIQLFGLVSIAQDRLGGAKDKRTIESLLLLPVRRRDVLAGTGAATALIGSITALLVLVPLALILSSAIASVGRSLRGPLDLLASLVVGASVIAVFLTVLGLYLGARASSGTEGSAFVTVVNVAVLGVIAMFPFLAEVEAGGALLAVPVLGPLLYVRDGITEGLRTTDTALVIASHSAFAVLLLNRAERALDDARSVVRAAGRTR